MNQGLASQRSHGVAFHGRRATSGFLPELAFVVAENAPRRLPVLRKVARGEWGRMLLVGCGGFCLLGFCAFLWSGLVGTAAADPPALAEQGATQAVSWVDINRPLAIFDLSGGLYAKFPLHYTARRDANGTARQDVLTYGRPMTGTPFLRLMFYRRGRETETPASLFLDSARLAADAGLAVVRSGLSSFLTTRFGSFETAGLTVSNARGSAACLAFRRPPASAAVVQIVGLACGAADRAIDPLTLGCTLDRVDLLSAGEDTELQSVFVEAERRRGTGCNGDRKAKLEPDRSAARGTLAALKGSLTGAED